MFTNDLLKSTRILITGGGTGLGRAMAERFLHLGATVYICGRRVEVVQKTAAELSASTGGSIEGEKVTWTHQGRFLLKTFNVVYSAVLHDGAMQGELNAAGHSGAFTAAKI